MIRSNSFNPYAPCIIIVLTLHKVFNLGNIYCCHTEQKGAVIFRIIDKNNYIFDVSIEDTILKMSFHDNSENLVVPLGLFEFTIDTINSDKKQYLIRKVN